MSALSKKSIPIVSGVTVTESDGKFVIQGPKGTRELKKLSGVLVTITPESVSVKKTEDGGRQARMNEGTMWSLLKGSMVGVAEGFTKVLEIEGIGYKAVVEGQTLVLSLGYAHPVKVAIPPTIKVVVEKKFVTIQGFDKEAVGKLASEVRLLKRPEPYKGKGIRYQGEIVRRKAGKKAATGSA
ncbi:MAG: 50S ribosomal protein L6 [Patescibacteria group bacterium]